VSEYKPEGATPLHDEKSPDAEIESEELLEITAGTLSARAPASRTGVPDKTPSQNMPQNGIFCLHF
jgi:hypothetical protein